MNIYPVLPAVSQGNHGHQHRERADGQSRNNDGW